MASCWGQEQTLYHPQPPLIPSVLNISTCCCVPSHPLHLSSLTAPDFDSLPSVLLFHLLDLLSIFLFLLYCIILWPAAPLFSHLFTPFFSHFYFSSFPLSTVFIAASIHLPWILFFNLSAVASVAVWPSYHHPPCCRLSRLKLCSLLFFYFSYVTTYSVIYLFYSVTLFCFFSPLLCFTCPAVSSFSSPFLRFDCSAE